MPRLSAVDGVAGVEVNGGAPEELTISLNLERAAALGIQIPEVAAVAARATDVSGGVVEAGRREYVLRFAGRYSPQAMGDLILAWRDGRPVRLGDVAKVEVKRPEQRFFAYQNGNPAIGLRIMRESGANVLDTLDEVKRVVARGAREGAAAARPRHRAELRRLGLHQPRHRPALGQPVRRRAARGRLPVVVPARRARDRADRLRHPDFAAGHLHRAAADRPQPQRDLAGGPGLRRRHGDGRGGGGGREHRAPARGRHAGAAGGARRHAPGRRRAGRVHAHHGRGVPAGDLHGGRRRPAVRRPGADDLDRGRHLAAGRGHGAAGRRGQLAARAQGHRDSSTAPGRASATGRCA